MFREMIGRRSSKVKNTVEKGAVKKFAEAIGDPAPIYVDDETGKASRYKSNIAPPTFPTTFDYGEIPELNLPLKGLIHGEQIYSYKRPLHVGEDVYCYSEVKDYYEKTGSNEIMGFLILSKYGVDENNEFLFKDERVIIINEAARKGMTV